MVVDVTIKPPINPRLAEALRLQKQGWWVVAITSSRAKGDSAGKRPIGTGWGKVKPTAKMLRDTWANNPDARVGLLLGKGAGIIDVEVDDPETGHESLAKVLGGECVESRGWTSRRGCHLLFRWDDRLLAFGKAILKPKALPGLEIRIGAGSEGAGTQFQSVCPPSPMTDLVDGQVVDLAPREWNGIDEIAELPEAFWGAIAEALEAERVKPPPPPAPQPSPTKVNGRLSLVDRAWLYLEKLPPAVAGQRGHDRLYQVACILVGDFGLDEGPALMLLTRWNATYAQPPESPEQIAHKLADAYSKAERTGKFADPSVRPRDDSPGRTSTPEPEMEDPHEWEPLRTRELIPVPPFPIEVYPQPIADFLVEAARAMQLPVDYLAVFAFALLAGTIGLSTKLEIARGWEIIPNVYVALVAPPGSKKSPALNLLSKALRRIDARLREEHRIALRDHEVELSRLKKDDLKPVAPVAKHLVLDDVTREAVVQIHADNPRGVILVLDELIGWLQSFDAYRSGKGSDRQFWLTCLTNGPIKTSRKGQIGGTQAVATSCVMVVGAMTPSKLSAIFAGDDDGWADRILFAYPDPYPHAVTYSAAQVSKEGLDNWNLTIDRLWSRRMIEDEGKPEAFAVTFDEAGRAAWADFFNRHHAEIARCRTEDPGLVGPLSKIEGFTARFALTLSRVHQVNDEQWAHPPWSVNDVDIRGAEKVAAYFIAQLRRVRFFVHGGPPVPPEARAILDWIKRGGHREFTFRDMSQQLSRQFEIDDRRGGIAWLSLRGYLRSMNVPPRGGPGQKPSPRYEVNPHLFAPLETFVNAGDSSADPGNSGNSEG